MEIQEYIKTYKEGNVTITPEISYSVRDVIETNRRLFHAKFKKPNDSSGLTKIFIRFGYILYDTFSQNTDVDTKDINMRSTNGKSIPVVAILKMATRTLLKNSYFGTFVNNLRRNGLRDGSVLVKKIPGNRYVVDLLNWIEPAHQTDVQNGGGVEKILMTYDKVLAKKDEWKDHWDEIEKIWTEMKKKNVSEFLVYEFWHQFEIKGAVHKGCEVYMDRSILKESEGHGKDDWKPEFKLDEFITPEKRRRKTAIERKLYGEYEELYPYKKCHLIPVEGRSVGFSVFELVEGIIELLNEQFNIKRKRDLQDLRGLKVFRKGASNRSIPQQFLENLEVGDIVELESDEELAEVVLNRVTNDVLASSDKLFEYARMITGAMPQAVGEQMPSGESATSVVANQQNARTAYDAVIEQMSLFLAEWFMDFEIDEIIDELDAEDIYAIVGDPSELQELDQIFVDNLVYTECEKIKMKTGFYPSEQEVDAKRQELMATLAQHGDTRYVDFKKALLKNVSYIMEIYVNNEGFDKQVQIQNIQNRLADPNSTLSKPKLEEALLDLVDLSGKQFQKSEKEKQEEQAAAKQAVQQQMMPKSGAPVMPGNPPMMQQ